MKKKKNENNFQGGKCGDNNNKNKDNNNEDKIDNDNVNCPEATHLLYYIIKIYKNSSKE